MAWYPSGVPDWLNKNELIEAKYDVDLDYEPVQPGSDLTVRLKESTEQFYERNHDVILQLLEQTSKSQYLLRKKILIRNFFYSSW